MCRNELQKSKGTNQRPAPAKGRCGCMDTPLLQVVRLLGVSVFTLNYYCGTWGKSLHSSLFKTFVIADMCIGIINNIRAICT